MVRADPSARLCRLGWNHIFPASVSLAELAALPAGPGPNPESPDHQQPGSFDIVGGLLPAGLPGAAACHGLDGAAAPGDLPDGIHSIRALQRKPVPAMGGAGTGVHSPDCLLVYHSRKRLEMGTHIWQGDRLFARPDYTW